MARRGRPRKNLTPIDKEKMQLTDDIVNQLKYNSELSDEQIFLLKKKLVNIPINSSTLYTPSTLFITSIVKLFNSFLSLHTITFITISPNYKFLKHFHL